MQQIVRRCAWVSRVLATLTLVLFAPAVRAGIVGFNDGVGWTGNNNGTGGPAFSGSLTLTDGGFNEARSAFYNTAQSIGNWSATFTYQAVLPSGIGLADGVTFMLQNQGLTALGSTGGGLGMAGITPSAEVEFNVYSGHTIGTAFETNGANSQSYTATGAVNLASGDPIQVSLIYSDSHLTETLKDLTTSATFSTSYTTNLASVLGSGTAFVGFTGGAGGGSSVQVISNFAFVPEPTSLVMLVTGFFGVGFCGLWHRRRVTAPDAFESPGAILMDWTELGPTGCVTSNGMVRPTSLGCEHLRPPRIRWRCDACPSRFPWG